MTDYSPENISRCRAHDTRFATDEGCDKCYSEKERRLKIEEDCEHEFDPDEGNCCLNCGMDGTEELMGAAEAACEGER